MMLDANPIDAARRWSTPACASTRRARRSARDVHAYTPQFALWADGATQAALDLPAAGHADRHDRHGPLGVPGRHEALEGVHARQRARRDAAHHAGRPTATTPNDWFYVGVRVERDAGRHDRASRSACTNANGTQHDIPPRFQCRECHEGLQPSRVLGFAAIQLDWATRARASSTSTTSIAAGLLTQQPDRAPRRRTSRCPAPRPSRPRSATCTRTAATATTRTSHGLHRQRHTMELRLDRRHARRASTTTPAYTDRGRPRRRRCRSAASTKDRRAGRSRSLDR